jgi:aerobic carbon-monoxide dehydrogenase large subunit
VQGQGRYTDDHVLPRQTWLAFHRSERAHARILGIDVSAARAMPGVLAIYTGADLAAAGIKPMGVAVPYGPPGGGRFTVPPRRALAHEVARFVGEALVAVVAETRAAAKAACSAIVVDYEDLPAAGDVLAAARPGAPRVWDALPDNTTASR